MLIFAKYLSLYLHIFTCTYRGTHAQANMYDQHTRRMAKTRHRSLVERKALLETLHKHTKKKTGKKKVRKKPMFTSLKKKFEHTELPAAKLRDNFITFSSWQCCCRLSKRLHGMLRRNLAKHCSTPLCDCWTVFLCISVCS